jgi:hypothetical protein
LILIFEAMASAEMENQIPLCPPFSKGKFNCVSVHSVNFAEPVPLFEKACPEGSRREGPGEIFS